MKHIEVNNIVITRYNGFKEDVELDADSPSSIFCKPGFALYTNPTFIGVVVINETEYFVICVVFDFHFSSNDTQSVLNILRCVSRAVTIGRDVYIYIILH